MTEIARRAGQETARPVRKVRRAHARATEAAGVGVRGRAHLSQRAERGGEGAGAQNAAGRLLARCLCNRIPQSQTDISQSETDIPQSQTDVSQSETDISQSETVVPQSQTDVSQSETDVSQSETDISQVALC